ncbi:Peptidyl-tRNA hydrolase, mitochondrial [Glycine soja]
MEPMDIVRKAKEDASLPKATMTKIIKEMCCVVFSPTFAAEDMLHRLSRCCFCTVTPRPWLFMGLGNPSDKFKGTKHNVGFEMIDAFAKSQGIPMDTVHFKAIFGKGFLSASFDILVFCFSFNACCNL